ncbi:MAG TPA: metalloregulator ArsR/SmtB family transcription factor [Gemmatimonadales bacterium]|nr:metalloregulator ArsR/SmtB family transcription factor [Gemmatimonadales bacterium]
MGSPAVLLDQLSALTDPIRVRLLILLENNELNVRELQDVLQLPQSTVSRHLKVLADEDWVTSRAEGPSQLYRLSSPLEGSSRGRLWDLVREEMAASASAKRDRTRVRPVLAERHRRSREFFDTEAGQWDRMREELFGARSELSATLGLLDPSWIVGDLGAGTGAFTAAVAPFVSRVIAVDESAPMLAAARARLEGFGNVEFRQGELELLPVREAELNLAALVLVLPFVPDPGRVLAEAAHALEAGGRILVLDLQPHERAHYSQQMGHLWHGFGQAHVMEWMTGAGLRDVRYVALPPVPEAKGPGLFVATATKPE